jgi:hypothetical protein
LPEVPGIGAGTLARRPRERAAARALLPRRLHRSAADRSPAVYAILFKAAAQALTMLAANPRRLGAEIGAIAVLHTWGQALTHHPHLHCVVPGGGLSMDATRWVHGKANFSLAVKPLARLFRRLFLERLAAAFAEGGLRFLGGLAGLANPDRFASHLVALRRVDWVVYAKKPFGGPAQVLAYLGRYTHRVAITNRRLVSCNQDHVAFTWKDYRQKGATKLMRLAPHEFIRRFLLHTLPDGFHRIRHIGFLANRHRATKLALCRALLDTADAETKRCPRWLLDRSERGTMGGGSGSSAYYPTATAHRKSARETPLITAATSILRAGSAPRIFTNATYPLRTSTKRASAYMLASLPWQHRHVRHRT